MVGDHGPLKNISFSTISISDLSKDISEFVLPDGDWNWQLFNHVLPLSVLKEISNIRIHQTPSPRSCIWNLTTSGEFSTKSAYRCMESLNGNDFDHIWPIMWKLPMAQRIRSFSWLLLKGKLLTNRERFRRKMTDDTLYSICQSDTKDLDHIFKGCHMASSVWKKILPRDLFADFSRLPIQHWLHLIIQSTSLQISWKVGICLTCWKLWDVRNRRIFTEENFNVGGVIAHIKSLAVHTQNCFDNVHFTLLFK